MWEILLHGLAVATGTDAGSVHELSRHIPWQPVIGGLLTLILGALAFFVVRWVNRTDQKYDGSAEAQRDLAKEIRELRAIVAEEYISKQELYQLVTNPNNAAHASIENLLRGLESRLTAQLDATTQLLVKHITQNGKT